MRTLEHYQLPSPQKHPPITSSPLQHKPISKPAEPKGKMCNVAMQLHSKEKAYIKPHNTSRTPYMHSQHKSVIPVRLEVFHNHIFPQYKSQPQQEEDISTTRRKLWEGNVFLSDPHHFLALGPEFGGWGPLGSQKSTIVNLKFIWRPKS